MTALLPWYGLSDSEFESEFDSDDPGDEDSLGVLDDASRSPDRWRRGHAQNSVVIPAEVLRPHFTAPDFGSDGYSTSLPLGRKLSSQARRAAQAAADRERAGPGAAAHHGGVAAELLHADGLR